MSVETTTENEMTETTTTEAENVISLSLQDLILTANCLDLAVQRGAYKGAEAQTVGAAFNKLVTIIQAIKPKTDETAEEATEESDTTNTTEEASE